MSNQFNWRQHLKVHPAAEIFPRSSADELKELAEDILKNGLQSRIAVVENDDGQHALDGISRLDAMQSVGLLDADKGGFVVLTKQWTGREWTDHERPEQGPLLRDDPFLAEPLPDFTDPYAYVISANIHRRHLSAEGKRNLIGKVLKARPDLSDRAIGEQVKADHKTVTRVRREAEGRGDIPHVQKRVDSKGRRQPATKAERKAVSRDTGIDKKARMIWGWLTAVEKESYLTTTPEKILQSMTPDMRADMHRLGASVGQWLLTVSEAAGETEGGTS